MTTNDNGSRTNEGAIRQILMDEHRVIERVLDAVERMVMERAFDLPFLEQALDFFRNYADGCHHAKEEHELFPAMEQAGVPRDGGPIGCMLHDHDEGRAHIRMICAHMTAAAGDDDVARKTVYREILAYVNMLRQHILKEDNVLFMMAENLLDAKQKESILRGFEKLDRDPQLAAERKRYVALADQLLSWNFSSTEAGVC